MALTEAQKKQAEKNRLYWERREIEQKKKTRSDEKAYDKKIKEIYEEMLDAIQNDIDAFYVRYAKAENISLAEAKKRVAKLDIERYERKAEKYVKDRDFSKEANEEMRLYNLAMKVNRLELLKAEIGLELITGHDKLQKFMGGILQGRTMDELKRQAGILGKSVRDNAKLAHTIPYASFHNAKFSDRIWMYQDLMKKDLEKELTRALIQGLNPNKLTALKKYMREDVKNQEKNLQRLMRTELARVQTEAQRQSYIANGFTEYTFHALGSACDICKDINGKHFKVKDMMPGKNASPMHPWCMCSTSPYEDSDEYEAWLDWLESGKTTKEWNESGRAKWEKSRKSSKNIAKPTKSSILEPEDKGDLYTGLNKLSDKLDEASLQISHYLNTLGLPETKWSGRTLIKKVEEMKAAGKKKKTCDIWLRENASIKNVIHEHLHARSISRTPNAYGKHHRIEEAVVELLAEEICKQNKIEFEATYKRSTNALKKIADLLEKGSYYDFSKALMFVDASDRQTWLEEAIKEYKKKHKIKGLQKTKEIESAMKTLFEGEGK